MKLNLEIAEEITKRALLLLRRQIIVCDIDGRILLPGQKAGEGEVLVDGLRACQEGRIVRSSYREEPIVWCPFVYDGQTVGAFGIPEREGNVTPEATSLLQGLAEVITHQHFLMHHVRPSENVQSDFLQQVMAGEISDEQEILRQADILQLNLRGPRIAILAKIHKLEANIAKKAKHTSSEQLTHKIFESSATISQKLLRGLDPTGDSLVCYLGNDRFLILKSLSGENQTTRNTARVTKETSQLVQDQLSTAVPGSDVTIGAGQYYPGIAGVRKSYEEARLAILVGEKVWGLGKIYPIRRVGMFVTLANVAQQHKAELAHQILFPLLKDEHLNKTVQTFLECGLNLTDAAQKLHIHRNTLIYRLDKTKKLISLDPRKFDDALQIKLGMMFYQPA